MMGKTHRAGAVLLAFPMLFPVLKFTSTSPTDAVAISLFLGGSLLTSRLPDVDQTYSGVGRKLWLISWIIAVFHAFFQFIYVLTLQKLKWLKRLTKASGHRGMSHTFFIWILFCLALTGIYRIVVSRLPLSDLHIQWTLIFFIGMGFGYLKYLILDYFSGSLRLFEQFSKKRCGTRVIPTNSKREDILRNLFLVADVLLFIKTYDFLFPIFSYIKAFSSQFIP